MATPTADGDPLAHARHEVAALWRRIGTAPADPAPDRGAAADAAAIEHAVRVFGLDPVERDLLVLLLGLAIGLPGNRRPHELRASEVIEAIDALGGDPARAVQALAALEPEAPLSAYDLIAWRGDGPRLDRMIALADDFWPRLVGVPCRRGPVPTRPEERAGSLALSAAAREDVAGAIDWLRTLRGAWPTLAIHGPVGSGRGAVARACAAALGLPVLAIDGPALSPGGLAAWKREVAWHQAAAVVHDADRAPAGMLAALVDALAAPVLATTATPLVEKLLLPGRALRTLELPALQPAERAGIWAARLAAAGIDAAAIDTRFLGARFGFAPGRIAAAAASLAETGTELDTARVVRLCRAMPDVRVGNLASRVDTAAGWDDLVVAPAIRRELELIVTWGRHAPALFAPHGPGGRARTPPGLACLLHGPAGTGKTLAAQVVAAELGLELYRVDLSAVVDKYIGETEKRLDQLFREAEAAGIVLLFDEADALFSQRTDVRDARDRYANLETGFLLQRLEQHRGLVLLASNHQRNIDTAFHRRLGVIVELPLPGPAERLAIWRRHLPDGLVAGDELATLAGRAQVSGGDIRNAVVFATLFARLHGQPLAMRHLVIGVWRELTRAGRLVDPVDFGPWYDAIVEYAAAGRAVS